jgi:hypothetical protein
MTHCSKSTQKSLLDENVIDIGKHHHDFSPGGQLGRISRDVAAWSGVRHLVPLAVEDSHGHLVVSRVDALARVHQHLAVTL